MLYLIEATSWIFEEEQHLNLYESINGVMGNVAFFWYFVAKSHFVVFKLGKKMREGKSEPQNKSRNEINEILVEEELLDKSLVFVINSN